MADIGLLEWASKVVICRAGRIFVPVVADSGPLRIGERRFRTENG